MLGPATRLLWRSPDVVHVEMGAAATVVEGLPVPVIRNLAAPVDTAPPHPDACAPDASVQHALLALAEAGYLWRRPAETPERDPRQAAPHPRLAGELTTLAARHGERAVDVLGTRCAATVTVLGTSRSAVHVAAILAAAGVHRVSVAATGTVRLHHAVPGGATPGHEGAPLATVAAAEIRRGAPEVDATAPHPHRVPDLVVLAVDGPVLDEHRWALHTAGVPYLVVTLGIDHGVVGPLVLPGLTSCPRCADLHRTDRDPAWPSLAAQLAVGRRHGPASDVAGATIIAGTAARQALTYLDGGEPAVLDATIELRGPDWRLRRRTWPPHPDCDCAGPAEPAPELVLPAVGIP